MKNQFKGFSFIIYILIIIVILTGLNINKFWNNRNKAVPVWSEQDREYYNSDTGVIKKVKNTLSPGNLLYKLTKIRPRVPVTYLKREIPLLGYYTPEELKKQENKIYIPEKDKATAENRVIKLKFDMRKSTEKENIKTAEVKERVENKARKKQPVAYIYHTHTSETYIDDARNQDNNGHVMPGNIGNVARVGMELANTLSSKYNFRVIHTSKVHDENYVRSYYNSRQTFKQVLNEHSGIDMVFDIHRDGLKDYQETAYTAMVNGQRIAKVMIVVTNGKFDFAHLDIKDHHQEWQRNLHYARKLAAKMEEMYPGLLKRVEIRNTTYNQDLHPNALLLEIGDYHNTTREALRSARLIADVIAALALS